MKITFAEPRPPRSGTVVVPVGDERTLLATAKQLDEESGGALTRAMGASRFKGRGEESLAVLAPAHLDLSRVLLYGIGKEGGGERSAWQNRGGQILAQLNGAGETMATVMIDRAGPDEAAIAADFAYGAKLRSYRFDKYRTKEKPEQKPSLEELVIQIEDPAAAKRAFQPLEKIAEAVFFSRDLISEPANVIYPETLAAAARSLEKFGVEVEILDEVQMKKLGMNTLLGVGQGSVRPPRLVVLQWHGNRKAKNPAPIAFIGKGVTFDTGGISIKPAGGMEDMKWDMAGSGVVIGLIRALAARKAKVNAVGIAGLVENMPSGSAQRPGDIVVSMSGQTVEVLNTDAEGRLVLADALWYCQQRFKPQIMIDLATLTGAIIVALGSEHAGLFSNNDELADRLLAAGKQVGEKLWRMPLADGYDKMMDSDAADVKNIGGREAGSITAAQFLQRFVNGVTWAHLDIAGTTWSKKDAPTVPKGATAFGVRLLDRFVTDHYDE
ncbi:MAG TPA: leucyl aminopeptidase [Stellaceae bacterium]|nr:leucyl aminopeptidase [Stellaceae bacterium]